MKGWPWCRFTTLWEEDGSSSQIEFLTCALSRTMRKGRPKRAPSIRFLRLLDKQKTAITRIAIGVVICFAAWSLQAQAVKNILTPQTTPAPTEKKPEPSPPPSPAPIQAIPLPQVADQAEELDKLLREVSKKVAPIREMSFSDSDLKAQAEELSRHAGEAQELLAGLPNMMQLQDEERYWREHAEEHSTKRKFLTERAVELEKAIAALETQQSRWWLTLDKVRETPGLTVIAERIQRELDAMEKLHLQALEQLNRILNFQNRISEQDGEIFGVLLKLDEAHDRLRRQLLVRDSQPLWAARGLRAFDHSIYTTIYVSAGRGFTGVHPYLSANSTYFVGMAAIYAFALLAAFHLKRSLAAGDKMNLDPDASRTFLRPYSIALLVTLTATIGITTLAPTGVSFIVSLLYLVPVLRLLPALLKPQMRKTLYVLCLFYTLEWVGLILQFAATFKRELFALMIFLGLVIFAWMTRTSRLKEQPLLGWRNRLLILGIRVGLLLLATALGANILGFVSLSQILSVGTLFSAFTFAALYTIVRVMDMGLRIILSNQWFRSLPEVRGEIIERWGWRLLVCGAAFVWVRVSLYLFTVRDSVVDAAKRVLQYPIGSEKFHITLGGTLSVVLFLLLGYLLVNIARFVLQEMMLPKVTLRAGLAYAISRVTYYILLLGLLLAVLTSAGVELNKLTVITGAVGLGVGFGLQNIVNNFASGLIILFERPIRIGDIVEVGGVSGTVRRIGARSSTVLTFQYAEVIIPNSNFLSNQVTNWTLTSSRRRVEIGIGVSYGTDPELALKILIDVANSNPRILKNPKPEASFMGFGESALNFELRFWAAQELWFDLKSEIGLDVFRALRKAGIEIPYPQRDLHLRSPDSQTKEERPAESNVENIQQGIAIGPSRKTG